MSKLANICGSISLTNSLNDEKSRTSFSLRKVILTLLTTLVLSLTLKSALANPPRHNPIPGGVALVYLSSESSTKPEVKFGDKNILVLKNNEKWVAVIGLSSETLPGNYLIRIQLEDNSKMSQLFRIDPIPASMPGRIIELPKAFFDIQFQPIEINNQPFKNDQNYPFSGPRSVTPIFEMQQIVSKGQYIPYGLVIKNSDEIQMIDHSWITYITHPDTIVVSPSSGVVERIEQASSGALFVVLNHGMGMRSIISNLKEVLVSAGDTLEIRTPIGVAAGSIQAQVDWQLQLNENRVDPLQFSSSP